MNGEVNKSIPLPFLDFFDIFPDKSRVRKYTDVYEPIMSPCRGSTVAFLRVGAVAGFCTCRIAGTGLEAPEELSMNGYQQFKKKIEHRESILEDQIRALEEHGLADPAQSALWRGHLSQVSASLEDRLLRVAVVGSVKSGKSTLINTLLERDLLKRGAGITTAFITRIRTDRDVGGWVELKSWRQIREEVNAALKLLPLQHGEIHAAVEMDIRQAEDRAILRDRVARMRMEWQQNHGPLNCHFIVLNNLLEGYDSVWEAVGDGATRLVFDGHTLAQHQRYAGLESQAAYVRDMELRAPVPWLGDRVEIADCQGSDSPNPLHLGQVQQYLMRCHFILYVISSRMGLRESDFKLLELIKALRMTSQTFFVLNVDLDVHPDTADVQRLLDRVRDELTWVIAHPQVFAFSGLFHLLEGMGHSIPESEGARLKLWDKSEPLTELTRRGFADFRRRLTQRVCEQRSRVLCAGGLSRLSMVAGSLRDSTSVQQQFLDRDVIHLRESVKDLRGKQRDLQDTLETLRNAIEGLKDSLWRDLGRATDEYFDPMGGLLIGEILDMVEHYPVEGRYQRDLSDPRLLLKTLHRFYGSFRDAVSEHLVERTNARVIEFAKEQEEELSGRFRDASRAFWSLYTKALDEYRKEAAIHGIELGSPAVLEEGEWRAPDELAPPTFSALAEREGISRSILLMKFGLGRLSRLLTEWTTRVGAPMEMGLRGGRGRERLEEAVKLVKSETCAELMEAFRGYVQAFKREYLHRLLEQGTRDLLEAFQSRASMMQIDFGSLLERSELEGEARASKIALLSQTGKVVRSMLDELEELSCAVHLEWLTAEAPANPEARAP
jgi:hypothetical protein